MVTHYVFIKGTKSFGHNTVSICLCGKKFCPCGKKSILTKIQNLLDTPHPLSILTTKIFLYVTVKRVPIVHLCVHNVQAKDTKSCGHLEFFFGECRVRAFSERNKDNGFLLPYSYVSMQENVVMENDWRMGNLPDFVFWTYSFMKYFAKQGKNGLIITTCVCVCVHLVFPTVNEVL